MTSETSVTVTPAKRPFSRSGPLLFLLGLLAGWLLIGWWLWPVQWTNSAPSELAPAYRQQYVALVAEAYWHNQNPAQAHALLADWAPQALARDLAALEAETAVAPQKLSALRQILSVPPPAVAVETTFLDRLLQQKLIVFSAAAAVALLAVALAMAVLPMMRQAHVRRARERAEEAEIAAAQPQTAPQAAPTAAPPPQTAVAPPPAQPQPAPAQPAPQATQPPPANAAPQQPNQPQMAVPPPPQAQPLPNAPETEQPQPAQPANGTNPQQPPQQQPTPQDLLADEETRPQDDAFADALQDVLASVFDDDDEEERLKVLLAETEEIDADDLLARARETARRLGRRARPQEPLPV